MVYRFVMAGAAWEPLSTALEFDRDDIQRRSKVAAPRLIVDDRSKNLDAMHDTHF